MNYIFCPYCGKQINGDYCDCDDDWEDDDYDEDDWREEQEERRLEELAERAATCRCGAWQFAKNGEVVHVADCYCGAE